MNDDWTETTLGDVTTFASGYAFPERFQGKREGRWPFYKVSDMNTLGNEHHLAAAANYVDEDDLSAMRARVWPAGTVVFPKVGAALLTEKRRILSREGAFDNNVMGLIPGPSLIPEYLLAFMSTVRFADAAQRGAVPSINQGHVGPIPFPLPPLPQQRRIVDLISAVDRVLAKATDALLAAQHCLRACLGDWTRPDAQTVALTDVCEVLDNRRVPVNANERRLRPGNVPYYGAAGQAGWIDQPIFDEPLVLLGEDGAGLAEWATRPVAYMISGPSWVNNHAHVLRATGVPTEWLYFVLRNYDISGLINSGTRPKLNRSALDLMRIPIPSDLTTKLDALCGVETVIKGHEANIGEITLLRGALLAELLTGAHAISAEYDVLSGAS